MRKQILYIQNAGYGIGSIVINRNSGITGIDDNFLNFAKRECIFNGSDIDPRAHYFTGIDIAETGYTFHDFPVFIIHFPVVGDINGIRNVVECNMMSACLPLIDKAR